MANFDYLETLHRMLSGTYENGVWTDNQGNIRLVRLLFKKCGKKCLMA